VYVRVCAQGETKSEATMSMAKTLFIMVVLLVFIQMFERDAQVSETCPFVLLSWLCSITTGNIQCVLCVFMPMRFGAVDAQYA
jgi:hypothetical protein